MTVFVILVISRFGVECWIWVLIASVTHLCIHFTFYWNCVENYYVLHTFDEFMSLIFWFFRKKVSQRTIDKYQIIRLIFIPYMKTKKNLNGLLAIQTSSHLAADYSRLLKTYVKIGPPKVSISELVRCVRYWSSICVSVVLEKSRLPEPDFTPPKKLALADAKTLFFSDLFSSTNDVSR